MNHPTPLLIGLLLAVSAVLTGCSHEPAQPGATGPLAVPVSYPFERTVTDYQEYPGRTAAVETVQVRARVSGYLEKILFEEGAEALQGAVLYEIDPRPYRAALAQAEAQLRQQEAQLAYLEPLYRRRVRLLTEGEAVAVEDVEQARSQRDATRASLNAARASLELARLNLEWTHVRAPVSGRLSRTLVTRGNLVVADQTLLTTIVSRDPMYAYFDADEPTVLRVQQLIREGKFPSPRARSARAVAALAATAVGLVASPLGPAPLQAASALGPESLALRSPVYLGLANEQGYPHEGYLDFINNQFDLSTATLQVRGVFPNPRPPVGPRTLSPGQFVRIRVAVSPTYRALLVSQAAIGTDQDLNFVYVLDEKNKVARRYVRLGTEHDGLQVIAAGLKPGERVVVAGLQRLRPGAVVIPKLVPMPAPRQGESAQTTPAVTKTPVPPPRGLGNAPRGVGSDPRGVGSAVAPHSTRPPSPRPLRPSARK